MKRFFFLPAIILIFLGCSDVTSEIYKIKTSSSPVKSSNARFSYEVNHLIDGKRETSWQVRSANGGVGQWIELKLKKPIDVKKIIISNGFQYIDEEFGDLYYLNSRLRQVRICANDIQCVDATIIDNRKPSTIKVNFKDAANIKITIRDIYKGSRWPRDLSISEIKLVKADSPWMYIIGIIVVLLMGQFFYINRKGIQIPLINKKDRSDKAEKNETTGKDAVTSKESSFNEESYNKGKEFEQYVASIFKKDKGSYTIRSWTNDIHKKHKGIFVEADQNPDFIIRHNKSKNQFAVECKYRSHTFKKPGSDYEFITLYTDEQLTRHNEFSKKHNIPVFVLVGYSGKPSEPAVTFSVPLGKMKSNEVSISDMKRYSRIPANKGFVWDNGILK